MVQAIDVSVRAQFDADNVFPKMKRCLDVKRGYPVAEHPCLDLATGLLVASDGRIMAVHRLQGYSWQAKEGAQFDRVFLPAEVLDMKGTIKVTLSVVNWGDTLTTVTDENNVTFSLQMTNHYPDWRACFGAVSSLPIVFGSKDWDKALKAFLPKGKDAYDYVRLSGTEKDSQFKLGLIYSDNESALPVAFMPLTFHVWFSGRYLRKVMTFQPTTMRYCDANRGSIFYNDDTIILLMPVSTEDEPSHIHAGDNDPSFRFDTWLNGDVKPAEQPKPSKPKQKAESKAKPAKDDFAAAILAAARELKKQRKIA